jgi:DNA primase
VQDLRVGDRVPFAGLAEQEFISEAFIQGFGFGDGTIDSAGRARVELCGEKDLEWLPVFTEYGHNSICDPPSSVGLIVTFRKGHFTDWKKLPINHEDDPAWLASWLQGYLAADGHYKKGTPCARYLDSQNHAALDFAASIAPFAGYQVSGDHTSSVMVTNYGVRKHPIRRLVLQEHGVFRVTQIRKTDRVEPVYCAVVPDGHAFVLAHGIYTGNCGYAQNGRSQSDSQIGNARNHSINAGAAVEATRQAHGMRNFFQIPAG